MIFHFPTITGPLLQRKYTSQNGKIYKTTLSSTSPAFCLPLVFTYHICRFDLTLRLPFCFSSTGHLYILLCTISSCLPEPPGESHTSLPSPTDQSQLVQVHVSSLRFCVGGSDWLVLLHGCVLVDAGVGATEAGFCSSFNKLLALFGGVSSSLMVSISCLSPFSVPDTW